MGKTKKAYTHSCKKKIDKIMAMPPGKAITEFKAALRYRWSKHAEAKKKLSSLQKKYDKLLKAKGKEVKEYLPKVIQEVKPVKTHEMTEAQKAVARSVVAYLMRSDISREELATFYELFVENDKMLS